MKKVILFFAIVLAACAAKAQFSVGADIVSNYVFRGALQDGGKGAIQPTIEYAAGKFSIGTWGSYAISGGALTEADLYMSFALSDAFSIGLTDYYYPSPQTFFTTDETSNHSFEINAGYSADKLSFAGNYIFNDSGNTQAGTYYFEAGYAFNDMVSLAIGGGNGWVTLSGNDDFQVSNIALSVSKEIELTEKFSLPVFGQAILNPNAETFQLVFGFSL